MQHDTHNILELALEAKGSDADTDVVELWASRGATGDLVKIASLATVTGKMTVEGGTRLYLDTMVNTEADASFEGIVQNSGSDSIAKFTIERNAYSHFLVIATTLNSDDIRPLVCTYEREGVPA